MLLAGVMATTTPDGQVLAHDTASRPIKTYRHPAALTRYDFATRKDLFNARMLAPLVSGESPDEWGVLSAIDNQLGNWITPYLTANKIANTINAAFPVDGQPALRKIDEIVSDCAKILDVEEPETHVRLSPLPRCYLILAGDQSFLILTSAILNLYEGQEGELRFIVGHELGHLKCQHGRLTTASYGIQVAIQAISLAVVPDQAQVRLPTLGLGRLCTWMRESEISADRAGLLCCQDPQTAYNALSRQLHGLGSGSEWIDPQHPDFDAEALIRSYRQWEDEPFVEFVQRAKRFTAESPFIPERIAALKAWADSGQWQQILARTDKKSPGQLAVIDAIAVSGLAKQGETVDAYLIAYDGHRHLFTTSVVEDCNAATWRKIAFSHQHLDSKPIFFEAWDDNLGADTFLGGFTLYPVRPPGFEDGQQTVEHVPLVWSWTKRSNLTRRGHAAIRLAFDKRTE